jgi:serine/threonine protein kinase
VLAEVDVPDKQWRLGNYEILEEIGRGGMGVIYRGRQRHSRRIVAVKRVLSYHADSHETLERFRREAEAAASLDHPNILPIYEVGQSEDGLPFFSMKFAPGGSLVEVGRAVRHDVRACVALMAKVARAVQYAHRQGILHRDLKPGNVLLDARGEPLVSDFGLAKWLDGSSDLTRTLTIFGTPGYIAPEQASGSREKLTPAADVYSLGAILFDLLAGRPPFLGSHALSVIRQASETSAPKLRSCSKVADRDLETICARCLERDPTSRYQSAADLAEDLERWLAGRPIKARPVLPPTKLWRWSRRNQKLASAALACLLLGTAVVWLLHGQWQTARSMAEWKKRPTSERSGATPAAATPEEVELRKAVVSYPILEVELRKVLEPMSQNPASIHLSIDRELAIRLHRDSKALQDKLSKMAETLKRDPDATSSERASAAYLLKDYVEAERLSLQAADQAQKASPARLIDAIQGYKLAGLAAEKQTEFARAIEHLYAAKNLADEGTQPLESLDVQEVIAFVLTYYYKHGEAEKIYGKVIEGQTRLLGAERPETLRTRIWLAYSLTNQGKFAEAESEYRDVIASEEKVLGPEHPETISRHWGLGMAFVAAGKTTESDIEFRRALDLRQKVLGPEHPDTLRSRISVAGNLANSWRFQEALAEHRTLFKVQEKVLGPQHPDTIKTLMNISFTLTAQNEYAEAETNMREALTRQERALGAEDPFTLYTRNAVGMVLWAAGKYKEAEAGFRETLQLQEKTIGSDQDRTMTTRELLAFALDEQGKHDEAELQIRQAVGFFQKKFPPEHFTLLDTRAGLAKNLCYQGKSVEAEGLVRELIAIQEKKLGAKTFSLRENRGVTLSRSSTPVAIRTLLANALRDQRKYAEADAEYRRVIELQEKLTGSTDPDTLDTYYNLAYSLGEQGKLNEAKVFAREAAEAAPNVVGKDHPYTRKYSTLLNELEAGRPILLTESKFHDSLVAPSSSGHEVTR